MGPIKMKNNVLAMTAVALLLSPTLAFSKSEDSAESGLNGWNLGFGVGYHHLSSDGTAFAEELGVGEDIKVKMSTSGIMGELHGGYSEAEGNDAGDFYWGGQLELQTSSSEATKRAGNDNINNKLIQPFSTALYAQLGALVDEDTAVYGIIGVAYSYFKYKYQDPSDSDSGNYSKWAVGLPVGLGVRTMVEDDLSLNVSAVYTHYQSFNTKDMKAGSEVYKGKHSPRTVNITVGLSWVL